MVDYNDNSDYSKKFMKLMELLPEVYQSDTNKSVFANLFDRFMSKHETEKVAGYVGEGSTSAIVKRQIHEPTLHRQAFQLQPILQSKIGSVDHQVSWKDIQTELERLGVDMDEFSEWGQLLTFNWVPPVDIDKLIHYNDYYWYDEGNPGSKPQYITIRSRCSTAISYLNFWNSIIERYGETIDMLSISHVDGYFDLPSYNISSIILNTNLVRVNGNASDEIIPGDFFSIVGTVSNNGSHKVVSSSYNPSTLTTDIIVEDGTLGPSEGNIGVVNIQRFDKILVTGDYTSLFDTDFVFLIRKSSNTQLDNHFIKVVESTFSQKTNITTIQITKTFSDNEVDGVISLVEQRNFAKIDSDCQCGNTLGWDDAQWGGQLPGETERLLEEISHPSAPTVPGIHKELWYAVDTDVLYQYTDDPGLWEVIWNEFSLVLQNTKDFMFWDYTPICGESSVINTADQWIEQNKWLHKNDVVNFSIAKKAQAPIIEYDWDLELNQWTFTKHKWKYRASPFVEFEDTTATPSLNELIEFDRWRFKNRDQDVLILDGRYGDQTEFFTPGTLIQSEGVPYIFEVEYSYYSSPENGTSDSIYDSIDSYHPPYRTSIKLTETASGKLVMGFLECFGADPSPHPLRPSRTSQGDVWAGYNVQWLYAGQDTTLPISHQPENKYIDEIFGAEEIEDVSGEFSYTFTPYAQQFKVLTTTPPYMYKLYGGCIDSSSLSLQQRALIGFDDIRVYLNGIRQYGNYDEYPWSGEIIDIMTIGQEGAIAILGTDMADTLGPGDIVEVINDSGAPDTEYTLNFYPQKFEAEPGYPAVTIMFLREIIVPGTVGDGILVNHFQDMVGAIQFHDTTTINQFDSIRIEVGEASMLDLGKSSIPVRMIEDDNEFGVAGTQLVSLINYREVEQVKVLNSQYPLFDIYNVDGTPAYEANSIFGFHTSQDSPIDTHLGLRVVKHGIYFEFDQFLLKQDNDELYAYRDYSNQINEFWFNVFTGELKFWEGFSWSDKTDMSDQYRKGIVSSYAPIYPLTEIDGLYWFDTLNMELKRLNVEAYEWVTVSGVDITSADSTLQTIWRKGLNDEKYIPSKVDWNGRTEQEYDEEQSLFVQEQITGMILKNLDLTDEEMLSIALTDWYNRQKNDHSETGNWVGDWEIPDPMYFNNLNENRKYLNTRELVTHFNTIITSQPKVPGYHGPADGMFHLIPTKEVNYGLGGKIKEYNYGFDTFLSSVFVNNVTPLSLLEFAHDQYESQLNSLEERFRKHSVMFMTNTSMDSLVDFSNTVTNSVITDYEQNDSVDYVYGDTTTFTDLPGDNLGVRNWIMTLPYAGIVKKVNPQQIIDVSGVNTIVHHDGHIAQYEFDPTVVNGIINLVVRYPDNRGPDDDTFGRISAELPPNTIQEFAQVFNTDIRNREGVYWQHSSGTDITIYRLTIVEAGEIEPPSNLPDGSTWMDTTLGSEVLRVKRTDLNSGEISWDPATDLVVGDGRLHNGTNPSDITTSTQSAWTVFSLDTVLSDIIFEVETRLYENAPDIFRVRYDFDELKTKYPVRFESEMQKAFLDYISQHEIISPYVSTTYSASDPWTWNYKYSVLGSGASIIEIDDTRNAFVVDGNMGASFVRAGVQFYVKNSYQNDGTWTTAGPSVYDGDTKTTSIPVDSQINRDPDGNLGIAYYGSLPCNENTGGESASDWRALYYQFYRTSYPNYQPWNLQGYVNKPTWWDSYYLNDDVNTWGNRLWKYSHGFNIISGNSSENTFTITGDFRSAFPYYTGYDSNRTTFSVDRFPSYNGVYIIDKLNLIADVAIGEAGVARFELTGDVANRYYSGMGIAVSDLDDDSLQMFTIKQVTYLGDFVNRTSLLLEEAISSPDGLQTINGASYDVDTNQTTIRVWNNITVDLSGGRIAKHFGMWENIRTGIIPAGEAYPNGVRAIIGNPHDPRETAAAPILPTYLYFSVNIDNVPVHADNNIHYNSDELLPPYWNHPTAIDLLNDFDVAIRSLFFVFANEIISPSAGYSFGDMGPEEWTWRESSQYLYDLMMVAFRLDPIKYVSHTFGIDFLTVNDLEIDNRTNRVFSHNRTNFHGDVVDDQPFYINGTDQWYVNFNRFSGYDINFSDFRNLWTGWAAPLTYQFSSFVDTTSLDIAQRYVNVSNFDYQILSKRAPGVEDFWFDAFDVYVTNVPPALMRYDNQLEWGLEIRTNLPKSRNVEYYDVRNYQFYGDSNTNQCTMYTWPLVEVNTYYDTIGVQGNQLYVFPVDEEFEILGSAENNGTYTVLQSSYDVTKDRTIINLSSSLPSDIIDGVVTVDYRKLPWVTGDSVYLSTTETLPYPLSGDTINGLTKYYVIVDDTNKFKLALTHQEALDNNFIEITASGSKDQYIGEIVGTFIALDGKRTDTTWRHYAVDTTNVMSFDTPHGIKGMQTLINIIDGYDALERSQGWVINHDHADRDPITSRMVSWQIEVERFIYFAYTLRLQQYHIPDRYDVEVDDLGTNTWKYKNQNSQPFKTGSPVKVVSGNGILPAPILSGITYYYIQYSADEFQIAISTRDAFDRVGIDIISYVGATDMSLIDASASIQKIPNQEINPARDALWFKPKTGIVSNVITGPVEDVRTSQLIFDQYGRPLPYDKLKIFRQDKITKIDVNTSEIDSTLTTLEALNPYATTHLGGMHLFVDAFEHVLVFNNYTTEGDLIYDPFIGLNLTKFEMLFNRQPEFTGRPNVGGYYFETFFNQNAALKQNYEAAVEKLRYAYDTFNVIESDTMIEESRRSLGYEGTRNYLDNINLNQKSQFLFWRGQIQYKGSMNAITAFINSRRFIDANIDEFWAIKIAEFGSSQEQEYPEIYITTEDARSNDLRLLFTDNFITCASGYAAEPYDKMPCGYAYPESGLPVTPEAERWTLVSLNDEERWYKHPDQMALLRNNGYNMYFNLDVSNMIPIDIYDTNVSSKPCSGSNSCKLMRHNQGAIEVSETDTVFYVWDKVQWAWHVHGTWSTNASDNSRPVLRHNFKSDTVVVTMRIQPADTVLTVEGVDYGADGSIEITNLSPYVLFSKGLRLFKNGVQLMEEVDYYEVADGTHGLLSSSIRLTEPLKGISAQDTDILHVEYVMNTLREGLHYFHVNTNIIQLTDQRMFDPSDPSTTLSDVKIWGIQAAERAHSPARLLDHMSHVEIAPIQYWDPARGYHYYNAIHNIDLQTDINPATFTESIEKPDDAVAGHPILEPWGEQFVGTTWLDQSTYAYVPYYDYGAFPNEEERFMLWGKLADWSKLSVYEWVRSDVPPSEWDELAIQEEGDITIAEQIRKSGIAKKTLFEDVNGKWVEVQNNFEIFDAYIEGNYQVDGVFLFAVTKFKIGEVVDIYVNEQFLSQQVVLEHDTLPGKRSVEVACNSSDRVRIGTLIPSDPEEIAEGIKAGKYKDDYQYTQTTEYDKLGLANQVYYFWVRFKGTMLTNKNRSLSAFETENQLVTIVPPYMFFNNVLSEEDVVIEGDKMLPRSERQLFVDGQSEFIVTLKIAPNTNVQLLVGEEQIPSTDITYVENTNIITIPPLIGDGVIIIKYVGLYDQIVTLPFRFNQGIIRGLRGYVNANRRYTIQFIRDFTLRDTLDYFNYNDVYGDLNLKLCDPITTPPEPPPEDDPDDGWVEPEVGGGDGDFGPYWDDNES